MRGVWVVCSLDTVLIKVSSGDGSVPRRRRRRLRPLLSPLERGAFDSLAVAEDAGRARVQLDEELGELELGEHGLQEALQENVDQAAVHGLVLEHVEHAEDALPGGVCADDVLQLIWRRDDTWEMESVSFLRNDLFFFHVFLGVNRFFRGKSLQLPGLEGPILPTRGLNTGEKHSNPH